MRNIFSSAYIYVNQTLSVDMTLCTVGISLFGIVLHALDCKYVCKSHSTKKKLDSDLIFWDMTPYSLVDRYLRLEGIYSHLFSKISCLPAEMRHESM